MLYISFLFIIQYAATGQVDARDPSDRVYNMVTKGYFSIKENRNSHRLAFNTTQFPFMLHLYTV